MDDHIPYPGLVSIMRERMQLLDRLLRLIRGIHTHTRKMENFVRLEFPGSASFRSLLGTFNESVEALNSFDAAYRQTLVDAGIIREKDVVRPNGLDYGELFEAYKEAAHHGHDMANRLFRYQLEVGEVFEQLKAKRREVQILERQIALLEADLIEHEGSDPYGEEEG